MSTQVRAKVTEALNRVRRMLLDPKDSTDETTPQAAGRSALGLLFWAWRECPDPGVSALAQTEVARIIQAVRPLHDREKVIEALNRVRGTLLDPFELSESELETVVAFVQIALSEVGGQAAVRIVPSSTIGVAGGLVLDVNLKGRFYPRSILEGVSATPWDLWYFAPAEMASAPSPVEWRHVIGRCGPAGSGYTLLEVKLRAPEDQVPMTESAAHLAELGTLGGQILKDMGVAVDIAGKVLLTVAAKTPEAMIKMVAALGRSPDLVFQVKDGSEALLVARMPYPLPDVSTTVPVFVPPRPVGPDWLRSSHPCELPPDLARAVVPSDSHPVNWSGQSIMEQVLETD